VRDEETKIGLNIEEEMHYERTGPRFSCPQLGSPKVKKEDDAEKKRCESTEKKRLRKKNKLFVNRNGWLLER